MLRTLCHGHARRLALTVRDQIPTADNLKAEFLLDPDVVFLNHGSFGACPRPVFRVYQDWQAEMERQPVEFLGRRFAPLMQAARSALAAYLGADADDLVYIPNAITGINILARSLPLAAGDEVLTTDQEYGACDRAWQFVCAQRGARYVRQSLPLPLASREAVVEAIWSGVTTRTRVLYLSHITSSTAIILPVAELVQRAAAAGILSVIDGAHAPGQIDLNLSALNADFYTGNLHKWVMAPKGAAFLYARRALQPLVKPLVVSWGWESEQPGPSRFVDWHEWAGTRDISAYLSVPAAIAFMQAHDWPAVRAACHALLSDARAGMAALTGLPALTPDSPDWFAQMAAFPLPSCDAVALKNRLYDEFKVEAPITTLGERLFLRVSVQGYNDAGDIAALLAAMGQVLKS